MFDEALTGALLLFVCGGLLAAALSKRARASRTWAAVATPLASIIGSGFLVVAPLLGATVGRWAPLAMAGIVALSWTIGAVIRFHIREVEPRLENDPATWLRWSDALAGWSLAGAYVISVAFYLRLLAAFVLHGLHTDIAFAERLLTTGILVFIGLVGGFRGLADLERLERWAVAVKLSIIGALLAGLAIYDANLLTTGEWTLPGGDSHSPWETVRILAGLLLVVQGFETSRYLGSEYDAGLRAHSMAIAQAATAGVYLTFVTLMLPLLMDVGSAADETAIVELSGRVHVILPMMLVVAAITSQFSAAVADTIGAGGLAETLSAKRLHNRVGFVVVAGLAIALTWLADIFQVIALASRGFALYYAIQAFVAAAVSASEHPFRAAGFLVVGLACAFCVVFAIPAG